MPIYEFECCKCGKKFERLVLGSDDTNPECPDCRSDDVQKLMSAGCRVASKKAGDIGGGTSLPSCAPSG